MCRWDGISSTTLGYSGGPAEASAPGAKAKKAPATAATPNTTRLVSILHLLSACVGGPNGASAPAHQRRRRRRYRHGSDALTATGTRQPDPRPAHKHGQPAYIGYFETRHG